MRFGREVRFEGYWGGSFGTAGVSAEKKIKVWIEEISPKTRDLWLWQFARGENHAGKPLLLNHTF